MNIVLNIFLDIVSILFGVLSGIAALSQMKKEKKSAPAVFMLIGSALLVAAVICNIAKQSFDFILALIGCIAICTAAICNGLKSEKFHIQHHAIRIALSLIVIVGFIMY